MYDWAIATVCLDELNHATASSITSPGDAAPLITETLRKSGVEELLDSQAQRLSDVKITDGDAPSKKPAKVGGSGLDLASAGAIKNIESTILKDDTNASVRRKKSVSFAKGTKEEDATTSKNRNNVSKEQSKNHSVVDDKPIFWTKYITTRGKKC